jgi:hypothetical protein
VKSGATGRPDVTVVSTGSVVEGIPAVEVDAAGDVVVTGPEVVEEADTVPPVPSPQASATKQRMTVRPRTERRIKGPP